MTEPTNPLFDDQKEFLERKKLEYERALRGDVEEIKEQTIHIGKLALVGAGIASGVWLLAKAFGGRKAKKKHKRKSKSAPGSFEDYAGFDGFEDDNHDEELDSLSTDYNSPEYAYDHADRFAEGEDDGFYTEGSNASQTYYQDDAPADYSVAGNADDDNGLGQYPDFPAHSSPQHGADAEAPYPPRADQGPADVYHTDAEHDADQGPAHSFASTSSYQARPYDDSRRLPESNDFADADTEMNAASSAPPKPKTRVLGQALMAFAQSETGRVLIAQAAAVALAFAGKKLKEILPGHAAEPDENTDLAASLSAKSVSPAPWPATTAAQDVSAAAHHDDNLPYREPLA